ncbi:MAG: PBSX family phage terminase large subunit [Caulobacteraceae bacterium]|nr:PBSX family phage terminase large subunit [Caulobacteraceae bacterium]
MPDKLVPVFNGSARYRGAFGGRGSAKTRTFAKMAALKGAVAAAGGQDGIILCARAYMNSLDDSSLAEVKAAIASDPWLANAYTMTEKTVTTVDGRVAFKFAGLMRNIESIKSKARILLCWVDEAEEVPEQSWVALIPTVREYGSEIWVTWNPKRRGGPTDKRFRNAQDPDMKIVEMNWRDNPWFPAVLERERQVDLRDRPDQYEHIWEGDYATAATGAYYAEQLLAARHQGRIGRVSPDPMLPILTYHDIGGAGAKADLYVMWVVQRVDREIRVLDHYASQGQTLGYHAQWLRERGWGRAEIILPHDGINANNLTGKRYEDHWRDAGFSARTIPNQGKGAAGMRIEALRRLFPQMWFNEATTEQGRLMLGLYAPKYHPTTGDDLGPDHDNSHDADALGLMAIDYQPPRVLSDMPLRARFGTMA